MARRLPQQSHSFFRRLNRFMVLLFTFPVRGWSPATALIPPTAGKHPFASEAIKGQPV
jgi:hypothetical protein